MADMNKLRPFAFVLAVQDLERNTAYFRDVLGFRVDWGDSSDWHLVARGDVRIMLGSCPDAMPPAQTGDHSYFGYLEVDDVEGLHDEIARKGAIILQPPIDRPYGMRECTVATPDGHRFVIGQTMV
ncbi:MAG TPA: VOC family protein [Paraburkholderia sp.]|uniref:VOC family protein n=1 Tax=Paraburkholderia sp. TaxID=1926495 RepID=UPI002CA55A7B|nr:VOC family protein [Paraburkholderia sp.]HTR10481.1 VOC family protein [Paraburkholderia sp.]